jgi:hypothetical protein
MRRFRSERASDGGALRFVRDAAAWTPLPYLFPGEAAAIRPGRARAAHGKTSRVSRPIWAHGDSQAVRPSNTRMDMSGYSPTQDSTNVPGGGVEVVRIALSTGAAERDTVRIPRGLWRLRRLLRAHEQPPHRRGLAHPLRPRIRSVTVAFLNRQPPDDVILSPMVRRFCVLEGPPAAKIVAILQYQFFSRSFVIHHRLKVLPASKHLAIKLTAKTLCAVNLYGLRSSSEPSPSLLILMD